MTKSRKTHLVALRDLRRRGEVAFKVGDAVPENAFPPYQRDALLATGGLRRELVNAVPPQEGKPGPEADADTKPAKKTKAS